MKNGFKSTHDLIMNLFKKKNPYQKEINNKNSNLLLNQKNNNNLFHQNFSNRTKYKTSKNSPENNLFQNNQKKYLDKSNNNNKIQMNNLSKIMLSGQKKDEIIKKKILHIRDKKFQKSNNNSISLNITNNIYQNYINNLYIKNKGIFMNKIHKKNENNNNPTKKNNSISTKKAQTVRGGGDIRQRAMSNYDIKRKQKYINNEELFKKTGNKYFNLINQYIASVSAVSKQPHRPNNQKNRYMTINAKKIKDIYKQNSMSNSQIYKKLGITMENTNVENINNININKIKNNLNSISNIYNINNNQNNNNNNLKNNFVFSSTSNSLNKKTKKPNKKISNFRFELRRINRTSYQSKQQNRIHSLEKSIQNSINHSCINRKLNSIAFIKNFNSPSITMYNKHYNDGNKKNIINVNNININNNNINKYLFNGVNNIIDLKRKSIEKSMNHLYKQRQKEKEYNYLISIKEIKDNLSSIGLNNINIVNNVNKKNKSNVNINYVDDKKKEKEKGNKNNNNKIKSEENNNINSMNLSLDNKKKENSDINKNINDIMINKNIKENKKENKKDSKEEKIIMTKSHQEKNIIEKKESPENNSIPKEIEKDKEKEKEKKKIQYDKDLSSIENSNDSLLDFLNTNIDYNPNINLNKNINTEISESNESLISTIKEGEKYTSYNRDMEIVSSYIKNYYKKNKKYPSTKMKFYKYGRLLGKGAFGKVNLGLHTLTGRLVAIKSINKEKIKNERQKQKIKQETAIMEALSKSKNIVKIFETYETKKHICIVMEYICAGDLLTYIKKRSKLTEPVAKFIFKQIILGIKHIHDNGIIHRDIKLDNILLDLDNNIKICDFGVSRKVNNGDILFEQCGTPAYIAPEILINKGYEGFGVDIWSAGVVLYAMLSGNVPFRGNNLKELHDLIINGTYKEIKGISTEAEDLLKKILEVEPKNRIKTEEILVHPWLVDLDFNFWKNQNLFTNAEYILLAKSNVDYRNIAFKEDMIENFNIRNLDTIEENINKNINTKSLILAPFNTSISDNEDNEFDSYDEYKSRQNMIDINNPDLKILNGVIKYVARVRDLNRNYELNNNQEIDNGVVITPNDSEDKEIKKENYLVDKSYNSKFQSRKISPPKEKNEYDESNTANEINENALDMIQNLGYKKYYMKKILAKNEFNYATTSYNLIVKYCFS